MKTEDIIRMGQAFQMVQEGIKFEIPEDVPVKERDMFMAKAAAAHKAGKSHFTMPDGKKHPVTMKKDTAKAVNSSTNEMSSKEKMKRGLYNATEGDAKSADKKVQMYVDPETGKKKVRMVPVDDKIVDKDKEMKKESTGFDIYDRIQEKHAGVDAMKKAGNAKADAEADERKPSENKKMALQKALQKSAAPSEKGRKAVTLPKAPFDIPKAKAGEEDTAKANPKLEKNKKEDGVAEGSNQELEMHTDYARPNSVNAMREAMQQMWQEAADREAHYKGATKPDGMKDNRKGKGAQDMMAPADAAAADPDKTVEKGMDDVAKAGRAGPSMKARRNDNMKGDKNIINKIGRTT